MQLVLINPNLVVQKNDPFTTGIVYMPVSLAYVAAALRTDGHQVTVIDAFGACPNRVRRDRGFVLFGLNEQQVIDRLPPEAEALFVYAINLTNHVSTIALVRAVKRAKPHLPLVVLENTQAVTAYALREVAEDFYEAGADFILTGEADRRAGQLVKLLETSASSAQLAALDGLGSRAFYQPPNATMADLDALPFPAWDLFPLEQYWGLRHAHGPLQTDRYLPLLTSRGCPYPCRFCVIPATNAQRWRARSAQNVVEEIKTYSARFGVTEFHIEDVNPTISDERIRALCQRLREARLQVIWKIAAGTKVESLRNEDTIDLMAQAGCRYISISPETGSERILKLIQKPFDLAHAIRVVRRMHTVGIFSQACFVLGFPGEEDADRQATWNMVHELTKVGVDEIALFIITPVPGSAIHSQFSGYAHLSQLNFSPTWRADYRALNRFRLRLYGQFLGWKLRYHPGKLARQPINFLRRRFDTKMEMVPYRAWQTIWRSAWTAS